MNGSCHMKEWVTSRYMTAHIYQLHDTHRCVTRHTYMSYATHIETWGAGVETHENKKIFVPLSRKDKKQISWALDVAVCYIITFTRFPYYISLSTIQWARSNGNLFGTNRTKKWVRIWKSEGRVLTVWISTPAPRVSTYTWVMRHIHTSRMTHIHELRDTYRWVKRHIYTSHVIWQHI